jgi:hypothetical protein
MFRRTSAGPFRDSYDSILRPSVPRTNQMVFSSGFPMDPTCLFHRTIFHPNTIGYIYLPDCDQWPEFEFRQRPIFLCIFCVRNISVPNSALYTAGKPVARGMHVGALHPLKIWMYLLGICKMSNTNALIRSLKNVPQRAAFTCCLRWIAVVGKKTHFQKRMYMSDALCHVIRGVM